MRDNLLGCANCVERDQIAESRVQGLVDASEQSKSLSGAQHSFISDSAMKRALSYTCKD